MKKIGRREAAHGRVGIAVIKSLREVGMNEVKSICKWGLAGGLLALSVPALAAYDSGSNGVAPCTTTPSGVAVTQTMVLPADGVLHCTTFNVDANVTLRFIKNTSNTPVTILATEVVTINGILDVSATTPPDALSGGEGGPGGYDGGNGGPVGYGVVSWTNGYTGPNIGSAGRGPGGGGPGKVRKPSTINVGNGADLIAGGGGAYATMPTAAINDCPVLPGNMYGSGLLTPLIGGSGGGGGAGGLSYPGSGGGGGGGAIKIASSVSITVASTGRIYALGGSAKDPINNNFTYYTGWANSYSEGSTGGAGSGGAIHLIAPVVAFAGAVTGMVNASGGASTTYINSTNGTTSSYYSICGVTGANYGGAGRIRIEADQLSGPQTIPAAVKAPLPVAVAAPVPTLSIAKIAGLTVPSGNSRVVLPAGYGTNAAVEFVTTGVPVGSVIKLTITPSVGIATSVDSSPTTGTVDSATSTATVSLNGVSVLQAAVSYTTTIAMGDALSVYAQGEHVERVTLASTLGSKESKVTLTTVSGKEYLVPASVLIGIPS